MYKFAVIATRQIDNTTQVCIVSLKTFSEIWVFCNRIKPSAIKDGLILGISYKNNKLSINPQRLDSLFSYLRFFHRSCLFEFAQDLNTCSLFSISYMSSYKVSWRCKSCGGVWKSSPRFRFSNSKNVVCPYCSGKTFKSGINDLQTTDSDLISDWDYCKNLISPSQISRKYKGKPWWKCKECGYSWRESLDIHLSKSSLSSCPECSRRVLKDGTSSPEISMYRFVSEEYDCIHRGIIQNFEFDILCCDFRFAIEYDGFKWHKDRIDLDLNKNKIAQEYGYQLIRIRENGLPCLNDFDCINLMLSNFSSLESCFRELSRILCELK